MLREIVRAVILRAIRRRLASMPHLVDVVYETIADPCLRYVLAQLRLEFWRSRGRDVLAAFAARRVERLETKLEGLSPCSTCTAAHAAGDALLQLADVIDGGLASGPPPR